MDFWLWKDRKSPQALLTVYRAADAAGQAALDAFAAGRGGAIRNRAELAPQLGAVIPFFAPEGVRRIIYTTKCH